MYGWLRSVGNVGQFRVARWALSVAVAVWSLPALPLQAQEPPTPDWTAIEVETLEHFLSLLRLDTSNPPGNETLVVEYLRNVLEREEISVETYALEPNRANLVARIPGNGAKRPFDPACLSEGRV